LSFQPPHPKVCGLVDDLSVPCDFSAQLLRYAVLSNAQQVLQGLQEAKRRLLAQAGWITSWKWPWK